MRRSPTLLLIRLALATCAAFAFGPLALSQIAMQVDHRGVFTKVIAISDVRLFVANEKGRKVRAEFSNLRFEDAGKYAEGLVQVEYGKRKVQENTGDGKFEMDKQNFEMEIFFTSDRNLSGCYFVLFFSSNGTVANYYQSIGSLSAGKKKSVNVKMPAHVDKLGITHVFSKGIEVATNQSVPSQSVEEEFNALIGGFQGVPITTLYYTPRSFPHVLSKDGKILATVRDRKTHSEIIILDTSTLKIIDKVKVGDFDEEVKDLRWLDAETLVFIHDRSLKMYALSSSEVVELRKNADRIVMSLDDDTHVIYTTDPIYHYSWYYGSRLRKLVEPRKYYKFNCQTKRVDPDILNVGERDNRGWFDNDGIYRLRTDYDGSRVKIQYRKSRKSDWEYLDDICQEEKLSFNYKSSDLLYQNVFIHDFAADNDKLLIYTSYASDTLALCEFDLNSGKISKGLYRDPDFDLGGPDVSDSSILYSENKEILGLSYWKEKLHVKWVKPEFTSIQEQVNLALPAFCNNPIAWTDNASIIIYHSFSDQNPGSYFMFRAATNELIRLLDVKPELSQYELASTVPFQFEARDGKLINGYLTLPPNYKNEQKLPMIVMPHGGPTVRDYWRYTPRIQFLATRGFAVLSVDYRGSAGYGRAHMHAGLVGNLDTIPIDDIADATRFVVSEGIADPDKICIIGGSWGGYSVYMSLVRYPEMYKCGVAFAAPTHLKRMLSYDRYVGNSYGRAFMRKLLEVGEEEGGKDYLERVSPLYHADKIQAPLLIAHGEKDWRVSIDQAELMDKALRKSSKECEFIVFPDSGHGFNEADTTHYLNVLDKFIRKHLEL